MKAKFNLKDFKKSMRNFNNFSNGELDGEIEVELTPQRIYKTGFKFSDANCTINFNIERIDNLVTLYIRDVSGQANQTRPLTITIPDGFRPSVRQNLQGNDLTFGSFLVLNTNGSIGYDRATQLTQAHFAYTNFSWGCIQDFPS